MWLRVETAPACSTFFRGRGRRPSSATACRSKQSSFRKRDWTGFGFIWFWLRHQPDSALSRWFQARVGAAKGRIRRIAIVALARKLLVALWRYVTQGVVPEGAELKAA